MLKFDFQPLHNSSLVDIYSPGLDLLFFPELSQISTRFTPTKTSDGDVEVAKPSRQAELSKIKFEKIFFARRGNIGRPHFCTLAEGVFVKAQVNPGVSRREIPSRICMIIGNCSKRLLRFKK